MSIDTVTSSRRIQLSTLPVNVVLCLSLLCANCATAAMQNEAQSLSNVPSSSPRAEELAVAHSTLNIGCGDLLEISVYDLPDMKETVRVDSKGNISYPLIGSLHAAGLSAGELETQLEERLVEGGYVKKPQVSVLVVEYATQGVSVSGEVYKPGVYPALGPRRLMDIISAAGGLTQTAGRTVALARRDDSATPRLVTLSKDPVAALHENVQVFPGDTVVVSRAGVVYVIGDVGKASGFTMDKNETLTLLQALALAEGVKSTAACGSAKIIRRNPDGVQEIPVNLNLMLAGKVPDLILQPEDIVFVPSSLAKRAARRTVDSIVQVATGVVIYRR